MFVQYILIYMCDIYIDSKKKKTIDLGHQGEPVQNVILRIYRQTERGGDNKREQREEREGKREEQGEREGREEKERKEENQHFYAERLALGDDCDEVYFLFYFFMFIFLNFNAYFLIDYYFK